MHAVTVFFRTYFSNPRPISTRFVRKVKVSRTNYFLIFSKTYRGSGVGSSNSSSVILLSMEKALV